MDWNAAIERHRTALKRVLATLAALAGFTGPTSPLAGEDGSARQGEAEALAVPGEGVALPPPSPPRGAPPFASCRSRGAAAHHRRGATTPGHASARKARCGQERLAQGHGGQRQTCPTPFRPAAPRAPPARVSGHAAHVDPRLERAGAAARAADAIRADRRPPPHPPAGRPRPCAGRTAARGPAFRPLAVEKCLSRASR